MLSAAIAETRTQVRALSPAARLGWLSKALEKLALDSRCLASAWKLTETERDLARRQLRAQQARQQALNASVARHR